MLFHCYFNFNFLYFPINNFLIYIKSPSNLKTFFYKTSHNHFFNSLLPPTLLLCQISPQRIGEGFIFFAPVIRVSLPLELSLQIETILFQSILSETYLKLGALHSFPLKLCHIHVASSLTNCPPLWMFGLFRR